MSSEIRPTLKQQIEKAEIVLAESRKNYDKNPDDFSARLLLMTIENHLADLIKQLPIDKDQ